MTWIDFESAMTYRGISINQIEGDLNSTSIEWVNIPKPAAGKAYTKLQKLSFTTDFLYNQIASDHIKGLNQILLGFFAPLPDLTKTWQDSLCHD